MFPCNRRCHTSVFKTIHTGIKKAEKLHTQLENQVAEVFNNKVGTDQSKGWTARIQATAHWYHDAVNGLFNAAYRLHERGDELGIYLIARAETRRNASRNLTNNAEDTAVIQHHTAC